MKTEYTKKPKVPKDPVEPIVISKLPSNLSPETLALIERINSGKKDIVEGRLVSAEDMIKDLKSRIAQDFKK